MKQLYAKIKGGFQSFLTVAALAASTVFLSACVTGGSTAPASAWDLTGAQGIITRDPASLPDISWQTSGERSLLVRQNKASAAEAVTAPGLPPVRVALLLPLSGRHADLGQSMLRAAQMALFDVGSARFELLPQDTKSTPEGAAAAAQAAAAAGASLVLGPVFADDVRAAKPVTESANIPMIAYTTDWKLAGRQTYIMGFLPFTQVSRVAHFAQSQGVNSFGTLAPQTEYADVVVNTLQRTGASVTRVSRYAPAATDLTADVGAFAADAKTAEGKLAFDALMLPLGGEGLNALVSLLDLHGIDNTQTRFIGTGLWDDDALTQNPALYGGWFAAPDPTLRRDFERRYKAHYGSNPPRLATLAYDSTALSAVLARSAETAPYARDRLTHPRGFAGIDGVFRFRGDGLSERGLAVMEIQAGRARVVDPAPTAFAPGS